MSVRVGQVSCGCGHAHRQPARLAITGGPGAGKTAVLELALRSFCEHVAVLPEAAGVVFGGGFPRWSNLEARCAAQRAIYHVQVQLESVALSSLDAAVVLCDRGTLDGLAYWPVESGDFWPSVRSSPEVELARYAAVVHLETPTAADGYNHSNALRIETAEHARDLDRLILDVWSAHPRRTVISSQSDFVTKATMALGAIRALLPACCHGHRLEAGG